MPKQASADPYEGSTFGGFPQYFANKKAKLQITDEKIRNENEHLPQIFRGTTISINGYTKPSMHELRVIIVKHGGVFKQYMDGKTLVTHIIATNLTPKKQVEFARYKVVLPQWVTRSIDSGCLLPWSDFQVIPEAQDQSRLGFRSQQPLSAPKKPPISVYKRELNEVPNPYQMEEVKESLIMENEVETMEGNEHSLPNDHAELRFDEEISVKRNIEEMSPSKVLPEAKRQKKNAEEHNAAFLADPRIRSSTVLNPEFLESYYKSSRLHHLSTWKAELKAQFQEAAKNVTKVSRPPKPSRRYILHVDFDCFFAAVSTRARPDLVDKPVCISHGGSQNSEVASCNYKARVYGVRNGMWMSRAKKHCPDLISLNYDFPAYEDASKKFYSVLLGVGPDLAQSVSIDEALLDITSLCVTAEDDGNSAESKANELALNIRNQVREKTQCEVSVGIGGNVLLAKVALRKAKPGGQYQIIPNEILEFLGALEVESLPGVGYSTSGRLLQELKVSTVAELRGVSKERLCDIFGPKTGEKLHQFARGIDFQEVGEVTVRKSVSAEVNWGVRFENNEQVDHFMFNLAGELQKRLKEQHYEGKLLTLKVHKRAADAPMETPKFLGCGKCDIFSKSVCMHVATNDQKTLAKEAQSLLRSYKFPPGELRGLGLQMTRLEIRESTEDASQQKLSFGVSDNAKLGIPAAIESVDGVKVEERNIEDTKAEDLIFRENTPVTDDMTALNGTQYEVPSQINPEIISELPKEIQDKIVAQREKGLNTIRSNGANLPKQEILDEKVLKELPYSIRIEIEREIRNKSIKAVKLQSRLPISPSKRVTALTVPSSPSKRSPRRTKKQFNTTLTQGNFIDIERSQEEAFDDSVLAELPEDIKVEVLAQARRERLKLLRPTVVRKKGQIAKPLPQTTPRTITLPEQKPIPTFQRFSDLGALRRLLSTWYAEVYPEGPDLDDVDAFVKYLAQVVHSERNLGKAKSLIQWFQYVAKDAEIGSDWHDAVAQAVEAVEIACTERGIGVLKL